MKFSRITQWTSTQFIQLVVLLCSVLQPGNELLSGSVPLGTPYPVLRYEGGTSYTMCSAFPCRRESLVYPLPVKEQDLHKHDNVKLFLSLFSASLCGQDVANKPIRNYLKQMLERMMNLSSMVSKRMHRRLGRLLQSAKFEFWP